MYTPYVYVCIAHMSVHILIGRQHTGVHLRKQTVDLKPLVEEIKYLGAIKLIKFNLVEFR